jgi:hypothetical protein
MPAMRSDAEPIVVRLARSLGLALSAGPLGRPDPTDAAHWYAVWQGDAFAD